MARHAIIDRSRTRRDHVGLDALELAEDPPDGAGAAGELARCLGPMMAALPDDYRLGLTRADLGGESQADLARELGVSASGLKSRVQWARSRPRAVLESGCSVARDTRGRPIEYERRAGSACPCRGPGSACGGG